MSGCYKDSMRVMNPKTLGAEPIGVERIPLGTHGDYKPCVAKLNNGDLLVSAFRTAPAIHGAYWSNYHDWNANDQPWMDPQRIVLETTLLFRSTDGGRLWSPPRLANVAGREPYLSVMEDGTLLMTAHLSSSNIINKDGYCYGLLHRSPDNGESWFTTRAQPQMAVPARYSYADCTTRNVIQLQDGSYFFIASGVGPDADTVFRSRDGGVLWDEQYPAVVGDQPEGYLWPVFGEAVLWQARSGNLFVILRVDCRGWPNIEGGSLGMNKEDMIDQYDRLVLYKSEDEGRTWHGVREFADYGQMYPAITRLQDGRLLLTFTQRAKDRPLGLRAVVGTEHDDGIDFDLTSDVIVIEEHTPDHKDSGGGFGRTVQLDDGTLVSSYSYKKDSDEWAGNYSGLHLEIARWRLP